MRRAKASRTVPGHTLDLLVVGHTNLDHFLTVDRLPEPDRTVPIRSEETKLGGTAANIALSAASWGVATGVHSFVGSDFPAQFRDRLAEAGVDVRGLVRVAGTRSPACYIALDGRGAQMTFIFQGPMGNPRPARPPARLIAEAGWVHLTTGDPAYQWTVAQAARRLGKRLAVDPAQEIHYRWDGRRLDRMLRSAEILFGNAAEIGRATELLGLRRPNDLLDRVPMVVETRGSRGARAYTRRGTVSVSGQRPRRLLRVTGAGDAFRGGFYAGWFTGQDLRGCLTAGVRSATRWIESGPPSVRRGGKPP